MGWRSGKLHFKYKGKEDGDVRDGGRRKEEKEMDISKKMGLGR